MAKQLSKTQRWAEYGAEARKRFEVLEEAHELFRESLQDIQTLQDEYRDWQDSLPDNLQDGPTAEKLTEVCEIDLDLEADFTDFIDVLETIENVDLPLGFGRD